MMPSNLRQRSEYADLAIECNDVTLFVHRYVVCSRSKVLAKDCENGVKEADITRVEHAIFDALTLERMLGFLYSGDYTLPESSDLVAKNRPTSTQGDVEAQALITYESGSGVSAANVLFMHADMYHVALYYDIADLQALALEKFKGSNVKFTMDEFLHMGRVIYQNPESNVGLRQELVLKLVNGDHKWLADKQFRQALADVGHNAFTVDVWTASFEKSFEREAILKTNVECQHESDLQLHSALEKAMADQMEANKQIRELRQKLTEAEASKAYVEAELKSNTALANENFQKATENQKGMVERDRCLEEKESLLEAERQRAARCEELIGVKTEQIKEKDLKIQEENNRANDNHAICMKKDAEISMRDKKIKVEKDRADKNYALCRQKSQEVLKENKRANLNFELCGQKDHLIKQKDMTLTQYNEKAAKFDKEVKFFSHAQGLINEWDRCRFCGGGLWPLLFESNNGNVYVRCRMCNRESVHVNRN